MWHRQRSRHGMAILFVLGMLALISLLSIVFVQTTSLDRTLAAGYVARTRALLAAESGVQYAVTRLGGFTGGVLRPAEMDALEFTPGALGNSLEQCIRPSFALPAPQDRISGVVSSTYAADGDVFVLRASDDTGRLNLNDSNGRWNIDTDNLPDSVDWDPAVIADADTMNAHPRLQMLVERLIDILNPGAGLGAGAATRLFQVRDSLPGGRFANWNDVAAALAEAGLNAAQIDAFREHVTLDAWQDPDVIRPTYHYVATCPRNMTPPADMFNVYLYADFQTTHYEKEPRSPVNVNTCSRELLEALIAPVQGWYLYEGAPCNLMDGCMGGWAVAMRATSYCWKDTQRYMGSLLSAGQWDSPVANGTLGDQTRYGEARLTPPMEADPALPGRVAGAIYDRVHGGAVARPFSTWDEFSRYLYELVDTHAVIDPLEFRTAAEEAQRMPQRISADCAYLGVEGDLAISGFSRYMADALLANFNPNSQLNDFNPDQHVFRHADKAQLTQYTTELCFEPTGNFTVESLGLVRDGVQRVLARAELRATLRLFEYLRFTTQEQFMRDYRQDSHDSLYEMFSESDGQYPAAGADLEHGSGMLVGRRGPSLTSYPEPIRNADSYALLKHTDAGNADIAARPTHFSRFDGSLQLSTWQRDYRSLPDDAGMAYISPVGTPPVDPDPTHTDPDRTDPTDVTPVTVDPDDAGAAGGFPMISPNGAPVISGFYATHGGNGGGAGSSVGAPLPPRFMATLGYRVAPDNWADIALGVGGLMPTCFGQNPDTTSDDIDTMDVPDGRGSLLVWNEHYAHVDWAGGFAPSPLNIPAGRVMRPATPFTANDPWTTNTPWTLLDQRWDEYFEWWMCWPLLGPEVESNILRMAWNLPTDCPLTPHVPPSSNAHRFHGGQMPGVLYPDGAFSEAGRLLSYKATNIGSQHGYQGAVAFWVKPNWDAGYSNRIRQLFAMGHPGPAYTDALNLLYFPQNGGQGSPMNETAVHPFRTLFATLSGPRQYPMPTHSFLFGGYLTHWSNIKFNWTTLKGCEIWAAYNNRISQTATDYFPYRDTSRKSKHESYGFYGHQWNFIGMNYADYPDKTLYAKSISDFSINGLPVLKAPGDMNSPQYMQINYALAPTPAPPVMDYYWEENSFLTERMPMLGEPENYNMGDGYMRFGWCSQNGGPVGDSTYDDIVGWAGPVDMKEYALLWQSGRYYNQALRGGNTSTCLGYYTSPAIDLRNALPTRPGHSSWTLRSASWTLYWPRYNYRPNSTWKNRVNPGKFANGAGIGGVDVDGGNAAVADLDPVTAKIDPVTVDVFTSKDGWLYSRDSGGSGEALQNCSEMFAFAGGSKTRPSESCRYQSGDVFRYRVYFHLEDGQMLLESPVFDDISFTFALDKPVILQWDVVHNP